MLIIPAIDLKNGCVVRYYQGRTNKKVYSSDPVEVARSWESQGAEFLHLVDLDGAMTGKVKNLLYVKKILKKIKIPVEFGGGVRSLALIDNLINYGVNRVVLGTKAVEDPSFLKNALNKYGGRVIISLDSRNEYIATKGWAESFKKVALIEFAGKLVSMGVSEIIYTDTLKDGTLCGPNLNAIKEIIKATGLKLIASGGISTLKDIINLIKLEKKGVSGIIIGKALYENRFSLAQAIAVAES